MIAFFSNLYKNDPIKLLLIIAVVYLLLNQTKVVENLKTDQVDLTAISTVSQLAEKWDKAVGIDPHGNVTFKKNVTNNGTVNLNGRLDAKGGIQARYMQVGPFANNGTFTRTIWFDPDGTAVIKGHGNLTATGKIYGLSKNLKSRDWINSSVQEGHGNFYLDRQHVQCPAGQVMSGITWARSGSHGMKTRVLCSHLN